MILTPSKSHSQYMLALAAISQSLKIYGHPPIELVFTDNVCGDKAELEKVLASLCKDVVPVLDHSCFEKLVVVTDWSVMILSLPFQINAWLSSMVEDIPDGGELLVGMDMEC